MLEKRLLETANTPKKLLTQRPTRYTFRIAIHMGRLRSVVVRAHLYFPASYIELRLIR
jgi:hypothetical protein